LWPSSGLTQTAPHPPCAGGPRLAWSTPDGASWGQSKGETFTGCYISFDADQDAGGFGFLDLHCQLILSFSATNTTKSFSSRLLSIHSLHLFVLGNTLKKKQRKKQHKTSLSLLFKKFKMNYFLFSKSQLLSVICL